MLDLIRIGFYASHNRITRSEHGPRFPLVQRTSVEEIGQNEAREMTGFSKNQLFVLVRHLRIPLSIRDAESRHVFGGIETLLHYLVHNRLGVTKL